MYYHSVQDLVNRSGEIDDADSPNNGDYGTVIEAWRDQRGDMVKLKFADNTEETFRVEQIMFSGH